jgi:hypothetical protein
MTSNRYTLVKNTLGRRVVVFCGCRTIHLSSLVLCAVRVVHESHLKKRLTNDYQWKERHAVTRLMFLQDLYIVLCPSSRLYPRSVGHLHSLEWETAPSVLCCVRLWPWKKSLSKRSFATLSEHGQRMVRERSERGRRRYSSCQLGFNRPSEDFASTQPFRRRSITTKAPVRSQAASLGICDVQIGSKAEFSPSTSGLPCLFHSSSAQYPLIYNQRYSISVIPTSDLK